MSRRTKIWLAVAVLFAVVNLAGAGFAIAAWELPHAGLHVALMLIGAYAVGRIAAGRVEQRSY